MGDTIDVDGRTMRVETLDGLRVAKVWLSKPRPRTRIVDAPSDVGA